MTVVIPDAVLLVLFGALGGFVRHAIPCKGKITWPHFDGEKLDLGFMLNVILGGILGFFIPYGLGNIILLWFPLFPVGNNVIMAFFAGLGCVDILENAIERIFGKKPDETIPVSMPSTDTTGHGVPK